MGGMVYMQVITNDAAGVEHRIKYAPFEPPPLALSPASVRGTPTTR
jgi:hypothetical protein